MNRLMGVAWAGLALVASACGGGGSGGEAGGGVEYTGPTAPAAISSPKAATDLAGASLEAGDLGNLGSGLFRRGDGAAGLGRPGPGAVGVARFAGRLAEQAWVPRGGERAAARVVEESRTVPGSCGGSARFVVRADDVTGAFTVALTFDGFCEDGSVLRGGVTGSGEVAADGQGIGQLTLVFDGLDYQDPVDRFALGGTLAMDFRGAPATRTTLNLNLRDEVKGESVRFQDFAIVATEDAGGSLVTLAGRCFHSGHGYGDVQTPQAFRYGPFDDYPSSGVLLVTGAAGTRARLTALTADTCRVEADRDGDGVFDWDLETLAWDDL
ncbi:MAG: hypothetical protein ACYDA8_08460 [Deferrisomatales bacterium]